MTEQLVLAESQGTSRAETDDFQRLSSALLRLAEGEDLGRLDPGSMETLRAIAIRLRKVWGKKGSFLRVGMSPFLQNLFFQTGSDWNPV